MKIYKIGDYDFLSKSEKDMIGKIIIQAIFAKRTEIDGVKYIDSKNPNTGEQILIDERIEKTLEKTIFSILFESVRTNNTDLINQAFEIVIKRFPNKEKIHEFLSNVDRKVLKEIYISYHNEMRLRGVEIQNYIQLEGLYQELLGEITQLLKVDKNKEEARRKAVAINGIKITLGEEINQSGGLEVWLDNKIESKKKMNNAYTKDRLIEAVLSREIPEDKKQKYARLLVRAGLSPRDIFELINVGEITPEGLRQLYNLVDLRKIVVEAVARMDLDNIIMAFMVIKEGGLLREVTWNKVKFSELKRIADAYKEVSATDIAEFLAKMYELKSRKFTEAEIDMLFETKIKDEIDIMRAYFELAKAGIYNEYKVIKLFEEGVEAENIEDPYEDPTDKFISISELLEFFNTDKVILRMREFQGKEDTETIRKKIHFVTFYFALLDANKIAGQEDTEAIQKELQAKLRKSIDEGNVHDLLIAIELFADKILELENMQAILDESNEEIIIDLYNKGLDDNIIINLYKVDVISRDMIELLYQEIDTAELKQKIKDGEITNKNALLLYFLGIIDVSLLGKTPIKGMDWEELIEQPNIEDFVNKIAELYRNDKIGFEEVKQLKELGMIGAKEAEAILNQLDLEGILIKGLTSEKGQGEKGRRKRNIKTTRVEGIPLEDRDELLRNLGFNAITNSVGEVLVVASGSFKGYRVYRESQRNFGVIIFENDGEGSSFIMHEAKAGEFIKTQDAEATLVGSRSDWREKARTEGSVTAKLHTSQWGRNIIEAIVETSSTFKFDEEEKRRTYVKEETKRLCEENKDNIEYLRLVKTESAIR